MKTFDLEKHIDWRMNGGNLGMGKPKLSQEIRGALCQFGGAVGEEVKKCQIRTQLDTREHEFEDGKANVARQLTIIIDFNEAVVQPHVDFEDDFACACVEALEENINGLFENQEDDAFEKDEDEI